MTEVGYSWTPLIKNPGIRPEMKVLVMRQPEDYFQWLGADIAEQFVAKNETPNLIYLFAESNAIF